MCYCHVGPFDGFIGTFYYFLDHANKQLRTCNSYITTTCMYVHLHVLRFKDTMMQLSYTCMYMSQCIIIAATCKEDRLTMSIYNHGLAPSRAGHTPSLLATRT